MEIVVWIDNAREFSQVTNSENAPLVFARCVHKHMMFRRDFHDAVFDHSSHFISFANRYVSVMMLGVITQELYDITRKEVKHILRDQLPPIV
jgi:hypothetical protein